MTPRRLPWLESAWARLLPLAGRGVHAVLLHGAPGVGKKSLALDFAEALLCTSRQGDGHACGGCAECRLTAAFSHPGLRWVLPQALAERLLPRAQDDDEPAAEANAAEAGEGDGKPPRASREIRVEQVRGLSDFLGVSAYRDGYRVVLIAPAEAMNAVAANTLLKMLEEPPPSTMFALVADSLDDMLPTIRSRCVLVQVPVPAAADCVPWLLAQGVPDPQAELALASGAPLAALAGTAEPPNGAETTAALYRLLERGPALTAAQIAAGIGRDPSVPACLRRMQCWAYDLLKYRALASVRYHPRHSVKIATLSAAVSARGLWNWLDALKYASTARDHPLNARLVIESLLAGYMNIFVDERR
jgi:DNA polymerase-3 subunit delta'